MKAEAQRAREIVRARALPARARALRRVHPFDHAAGARGPRASLEPRDRACGQLRAELTPWGEERAHVGGELETALANSGCQRA
jgi:hypothetical protein